MSAHPTPNRSETPASASSSEAADFGRPPGGWRRKLFGVIFEADTRAGRAFDLALLLLIVASVVVVMIDSVEGVGGRHAALLNALEWMFTLIFTAEYLARLTCVERPRRYARSFSASSICSRCCRPTWHCSRRNWAC